MNKNHSSGGGHTVEDTVARENVARALRSLADRLEDGVPVRIVGDDGAVSATVGRQVTLGVEAGVDGRRDGTDPENVPSTGRLVLSLEWDDPDGSSVRTDVDADTGIDGVLTAVRQLDDGREGKRKGDDDEGEGEGEGEDEDEAEDENEAPADSAMATMPPEGVVRDRDSSGWTPGAAGGADRTERTARTAGETSCDRTEPGRRRSRFEVYQDQAGEWRWRLVHWNGNIVADSGEGYASRSNAERAVRSVIRTASTAAVMRAGSDRKRDDGDGRRDDDNGKHDGEGGDGDEDRTG
ncbi:amphi-Trp domain-containing protein [Halobiforma nitratireducens]|uniref:DUF1508 domain-containing protein n=1 Tax=Halobiforma nitratireducens JCM 10879 TaxID=1227454 RepID=M0M7J9_9EURY|nr:DUF1508 domain-containing protein [Halobiforma nitratireducens]EMA41691.1 hypothetical protein C446_05230 [Halobiforma nitratireducens JCM 10879]